MTSADTLKPSVRFWKHSGITELEPDVDYAAVYVHTFAGPSGMTFEPDVSNVGRRPFKFTWMHGMIAVVADPLADPDSMIIVTGDFETWIVGYWDKPMNPPGWFNTETGNRETTEKTWQQYAAHQLGQVLRQRDLAQRLTDFGIPRAQEEYLPINTANAVERSLTLNYDELDKLLKAAGF